MVVKTDLSDSDFVSILSAYDLGDYIQAEPIAAGTVQTNYIVRTSRGKFVLRMYENRPWESTLFETDLLAYLTARHYPCPALCAPRAGTLAIRYQGKPCAISEFVEGHHVEEPTDRQMQRLIQKAAELQFVTRDFRSKYTPYRWNYTPELCLQLGQAEAARLGTDTARAKLAWLTRALAALDLPLDLPRGVCHCDFHFSNVLWRGDAFAALIDFDDANWTYPQFDLVVLIESAAWHHPAETLDLMRAREVVQTYERTRPLPEIERRHLFDVYRLGILLDCIWFFDRGGAEDFYEKRKIDALTRLGRRAFMEALF